MPLLTFWHIDLFFSQDELVDIHKAIQPTDKTLKDPSLFNKELIWMFLISEYLPEFLTPLPIANYAMMVISTRGHWTTTLFAKVSPEGINDILNLFEHVMQCWAEQVQEMLLGIVKGFKNPRGLG